MMINILFESIKVIVIILSIVGFVIGMVDFFVFIKIIGIGEMIISPFLLLVFFGCIGFVRQELLKTSENKEK